MSFFVQSIRLEFINFELESAHDSKGCIYDNVTVYDVNNMENNVVGTFCGDLLPDAVGAVGEQLLIEFQSDRQLTYAGFRTRFVLRNTTGAWFLPVLVLCLKL